MSSVALPFTPCMSICVRTWECVYNYPVVWAVTLHLFSSLLGSRPCLLYCTCFASVKMAPSRPLASVLRVWFPLIDLFCLCSSGTIAARWYAFHSHRDTNAHVRRDILASSTFVLYYFFLFVLFYYYYFFLPDVEGGERPS